MAKKAGNPEDATRFLVLADGAVSPRTAWPAATLHRIDQTLTWTSWPARERPARAAIVIVVLLAFAWLATRLAESTTIGAIAGAALFATLHRFFLPVRCSINREEAVVRTALRSRTIRLSTVRRVAHDGKAILLTPRIDGGAAALARGLVMPLPAEGGEHIVRDVAARLSASGGIVGTP